MIMDKAFWQKTMENLANPSRVCVLETRGVCIIASQENKNDTVGWYYINGKQLESSLKESGLTWRYVIEEMEDTEPCIYMIVGKDADRIKDVISDFTQSADADDERFYFYEGAFSDVDINRHVNSDLLDAISPYASDIIQVYEA